MAKKTLEDKDKALIYRIFSPLFKIVDGPVAVFNAFKSEAKYPFYFVLTFLSFISVLSFFSYLFYQGFLIFASLDTVIQFYILIILLITIGLFFTLREIKFDSKLDELSKNLQTIAANVENYKVPEDLKKSAFSIFSIISIYTILYILSLSRILPVKISLLSGQISLIITTIWGCYLAYRLDSRFILIISFLGGSFAEYLLFFDEDSNLSLWIMALNSIMLIRVTYLIKWQFMHFVVGSMLLLLSWLHIQTSDNELNMQLFIVFSFSAFVYLSTYLIPREFYYLGDKSVTKKIFAYSDFVFRKKMDVLHHILVSLSTIYLLWNLYVLYPDSVEFFKLGLLYCVSSIPFIVMLFVFDNKLPRESKLSAFLISGTYVALGIYMISHENAMIDFILASMVAITLMYWGFRFTSGILKIMGYILLFVCLIILLLSYTDLNTNPLDHRFGDGYKNLWLTVSVLIAAVTLIHKYEQKLSKWDERLRLALHEILSVWLAGTLIFTGWKLSTIAYPLVVFCVGAYLMYRSYKNILPVSRILSHLLIISSIFISLSIHFFDNYENSIWVEGYWKLIIACLMIWGYRMWFIHLESSVFDSKTIKYEVNPKVNKIVFCSILHGIEALGIVYAVWFTARGFTEIYYVAIFTSLAALLLIHRGYRFDFVFDRTIGYLVYIGVFIFTITRAVEEVTAKWFLQSITETYPNLLVSFFLVIQIRIWMVLVFKKNFFYHLTASGEFAIKKPQFLYPAGEIASDIIYGIRLLTRQNIRKSDYVISKPARIQLFYDVVDWLLAFWSGILYFFIIDYYQRLYSVHLLIIPICIYLLYGFRFQNKWIEWLGWSALILQFFILIFRQVVENSINVFDTTYRQDLLSIALILTSGILWLGVKIFHSKINREILKNSLRETFVNSISIFVIYYLRVYHNIVPEISLLGGLLLQLIFLWGNNTNFTLYFHLTLVSLMLIFSIFNASLLGLSGTSIILFASIPIIRQRHKVFEFYYTESLTLFTISSLVFGLTYRYFGESVGYSLVCFNFTMLLIINLLNFKFANIKTLLLFFVLPLILSSFAIYLRFSNYYEDISLITKSLEIIFQLISVGLLYSFYNKNEALEELDKLKMSSNFLINFMLLFLFARIWIFLSIELNKMPEITIAILLIHISMVVINIRFRKLVGTTAYALYISSISLSALVYFLFSGFN